MLRNSAKTLQSWNTNFNNQTGTAFGTFGGQMVPMCNYMSPLAKPHVYKNKNIVYYPLRRHVFRLKVRTAAEIRINEVVKQYMNDKFHGKYGHCLAIMTNNIELDQLGCIIPKDEYEVKKFTSYMSTKKASTDYKNARQAAWRMNFFQCMAKADQGWYENVNWQLARLSSDEENLCYLWYSMAFMLSVGTMTTLVYWWYKYSQQVEYLEL